MVRILCLFAVSALSASSFGADDPARPVSFKEHVAPILVKKCLGCHNAQKAANGLNMATFALLKKGGKTLGELILEPGDPEGSSLIELVRPDGSPRMPYKLPPLSDHEIATLEQWVGQGAKFDGPSESETRISSLVDPLRDLPRVALKTPAADPVTALDFAPDGATLAAAVGRQVVLFDVASGKPKSTLAGHPGPLTSVRFTPDGATLVAAGGRPGMFGAITVWDLARGARRHELRGHADSILAAALTADGRTLATAGYDRLILLWDVVQGKVLRTFKDHTDAVYSVAFSPDGKRLASAAADRTVKLWDVATGQRLRTLSDATAELYAVAFAPDGKTVWAGGVDRSIRAWDVEAQDAPLVNSAFAHDAAVLRLVASADGKTLLSSGEDKDVKVWDLPSLKPRAALDDQPDWPQAVALSPDGARIAVGRYDGSLATYDARTGKPALALLQAPASRQAAKPELFRNATLDPPNPRGAARGSTLRVTLTGIGAGRATRLVFVEPGLSAALVPAEKPDPNRLSVELTVAADARVGVHRIGAITPLGVPDFQMFAVSAHPEAAEAEPNDEPAQVPPVHLPASLVGTIGRPGDVDHFRFEAQAGQQLVFEAVSKSLGSSLLGVLTLVDDQGRPLAELGSAEGRGDPVLTVTIPRDGVYTLRVADADYSGSGNHFYRIAAAAAPYLESAFPLGVARGQTTPVQVSGRNLQGVSSVALAVPADAEPGGLLDVPAVLPDGSRPINRRSVVVAEGPQRVESEPNEEPSRAEPIATPGGISARFGHAGDVDHFRFEGKKGQRIILETFGSRLGTPVDTVVEILDAQGRPIPRAVLRPVDQTEVAFRDHGSSSPKIRLTRWNNLAVNDPVLIGRELTRVQTLPRNPDDDCRFWSDRGERLGLLETTPEHHPMGQPIYKVEIHPPGTTFPPGGVPPVTLYVRNDDGGPGFEADSRLTFDPPADGLYIARVEDVRGRGGAEYSYHLVVRRPRPDFRLALSTENPNVPRGGTAILTASVARRDGFDAAVDVAIDGLPPGVTATPARIEPGEFTADFVLMASPTAPAFSPPTWRVTARSVADPPSASGEEPTRHEVDPGGPDGGWVTVTPEPNLHVTARPTRVEIRPGQRVTMTLAVARGPAFAGRVPIEVRNLPQGVRVLDIGLNGVLVTEKQDQRTVFLYADPGVAPLERLFFAVGKAEAAGTEDSSPPIELIVRPGPGSQAAASVGQR